MAINYLQAPLTTTFLPANLSYICSQNHILIVQKQHWSFHSESPFHCGHLTEKGSFTTCKCKLTAFIDMNSEGVMDKVEKKGKALDFVFVCG